MNNFEKYRKNYFIVFLFCLMISLILNTCSLGSDSDEEISFGLYKLKDESLTWEKFQKISNKDSLEIVEWIAPDKIQSYEYSSHILILNVDAKITAGNWRSGIFVAVAGGKRCYYGSLSPSTNYQNGKTAVWFQVIDPASDMVWLMQSSCCNYNDERNDEYIKKALKSSGKFRGGISVALDDLQVSSIHDTAYFDYSFTVSNIDDQNLYVIDPENYATNSFTMGGMTSNTTLYIYGKEKTGVDYRTYRLEPANIKSSSRISITQDNLKPENLLYLKKGSSITRSYKQTITSSIRTLPYGNYYARIQYANVLGASPQQRTISGGRVLCGFTYSNILDISYSKEKGIVINNRDVTLE